MSPQSADRCGSAISCGCKYVSKVEVRLGKMVIILKGVERGEGQENTSLSSLSRVRKRGGNCFMCGLVKLANFQIGKK